MLLNEVTRGGIERITMETLSLDEYEFDSFQRDQLQARLQDRYAVHAVHLELAKRNGSNERGYALNVSQCYHS